MSEFIEHSKDPWGTSAVTDHFGGKNQGQRPGTDSALTRPAYGTPAWNSQVGGGMEQTGLQNTVGPVKGPSMFNAPKQNLPRETGVNYKPQINAGHRVPDDPFSLADGFPGN
jgi:hypothetical protein